MNVSARWRTLREAAASPIMGLAVIFAVSAQAFAGGTLQITDVKVEGTQVTIPVVLGGDGAGSVSALDFRLNYNPEVLRPLSASAGAAALGADKRVMANMSAPGEYIVVMMGMNQTTCSAGEVAQVVMERVSDSQNANWGLGITRPTLSSLDGSVIASTALPYTQPGSTQDESQGKPGSETEPAKAGTDSTAAQNAPSDSVSVTEVDTAATPDAPRQPAPKDGGHARDELAKAIANRDRARAELDGRPDSKAPDSAAPEQASPEGSKEPAGANTAVAPAPEGAAQKERTETSATVERKLAQAAPRAEEKVQTDSLPRRPGVYALVVICGLVAAGVLVWRKRCR